MKLLALLAVLAMASLSSCVPVGSVPVEKTSAYSYPDECVGFIYKNELAVIETR